MQTTNLAIGPVDRTSCTKRNPYRPSQFLSKVNCRHGQKCRHKRKVNCHIVNGKKKCTTLAGGFSGDPDTRVRKRCPTFANYRPFAKALGGTPAAVDQVQWIAPSKPKTSESRPKYTVRWRYITKDGKYVLVHDFRGRRSDDYLGRRRSGAIWVFVKARCVTTPHKEDPYPPRRRP